ncbi:MAG TPA: RagB/SusD family nutrient uptake outer membrane protein, partial [Flavisolibacter sp.]
MQFFNIKKAASGIVFCTAILMASSCKKSFLEEELITTKSLQDLTTPVGLDDLSIGMYQNLKFHFNYEWTYASTNYGVDEFTVGGDRTMQMWNSYDANLNSLTGDVGTIFSSMYATINSANILIENVPLYYGNNANKNTRLGEGFFMRAFNYFKLVKQFGGVPLKLSQTTTLETEFTRSTAKETYSQVIKDFTEAYNLLPATPAETGRITKYAAAHFLAKAYLFRASELYND